MIRIYIAGPMTSVGGNFNIPLFDHVAERLRSTGKCEVFNPADLAREKLGSLEKIMKMDKAWLNQARGKLLKIELNWIMDNADWVLMLPGWERSEGATAERAVAIAFKIPVRECPNIILLDGDVKTWDITALEKA
jgi:hypothetical protein